MRNSQSHAVALNNVKLWYESFETTCGCYIPIETDSGL